MLAGSTFLAKRCIGPRGEPKRIESAVEFDADSEDDGEVDTNGGPSKATYHTPQKRSPFDAMKGSRGSQRVRTYDSDEDSEIL